MLGIAAWVTNLIVTNGIEMLAFLDHEDVSQHPDLFWLLFRLTRVLFAAEVVTWSIAILGFSIAGLRSATIPKWLVALGLLQATAGMLVGGFIVSIVNEGWATIFIEVAAISGMIWFVGVGVHMVMRGDS